jgi:hypothetical protein
MSDYTVAMKIRFGDGKSEELIDTDVSCEWSDGPKEFYMYISSDDTLLIFNKADMHRLLRVLETAEAGVA